MAGPKEASRSRVSEAVWRWWDGDDDAAAVRRARHQGLVQAGVGIAAAAVIAVLGHPVAAAVVVLITLVVLSVALLSPRRAHARLQGAVGRFAHGVGTVLTWVLMPLLFYLVFLPTGWLLRERRRLRLTRWPDPELASYWTQQGWEGDRESYRRPF